jgi:dTMP kinase
VSEPDGPPRGLFVSFEGIDGSGKSTQARLLAARLRDGGQEVVLTREPGGSPGAEEIRRLVLTGDRSRWSAETEILLFTAARRDHLERTIRPALARGAVVITDRFADSTRLYQGATRGDLRAVVDQLHALMIGVEPDLTVVIDMDPEKALSRSLARLAEVNRDLAADHATAAAGKQLSGAPVENLGFTNSELEEARRLTEGAEVLERLATSLTTGDPPEDRFETFGVAFQERIRQGFLDLARDAPHRIALVDGDRPEAEVAADVARVALDRLRAAGW